DGDGELEVRLRRDVVRPGPEGSALLVAPAAPDDVVAIAGDVVRCVDAEITDVAVGGTAHVDDAVGPRPAVGAGLVGAESAEVLGVVGAPGHGAGVVAAADRAVADDRLGAVGARAARVLVDDVLAQGGVEDAPDGGVAVGREIVQGHADRDHG